MPQPRITKVRVQRPRVRRNKAAAGSHPLRPSAISLNFEISLSQPRTKPALDLSASIKNWSASHVRDRHERPVSKGGLTSFNPPDQWLRWVKSSLSKLAS